MFFRIKNRPAIALMSRWSRTSALMVPRAPILIANLGRADDLIASGALASLLSSGAKLTDQVLLISALDEDADGSLSFGRARRLAVALEFGNPSFCVNDTPPPRALRLGCGSRAPRPRRRIDAVQGRRSIRRGADCESSPRRERPADAGCAV